MLEAAIIPLALDALTHGQSVTPASHWQGTPHQRSLGGGGGGGGGDGGGGGRSLRGESLSGSRSLGLGLGGCGGSGVGGGGSGSGRAGSRTAVGGSLISGVYRHRARCLYTSSQLHACLLQWCKDGVAACPPSSAERTGTRASSSAGGSSETRSDSSTPMFLSLCAPVQSLALLVRGRGIKSRAKASDSSSARASAGVDGQGLASASVPGLVSAPCPSSSFSPRSVLAALTEGLGSFVRLEPLSVPRGSRNDRGGRDDWGSGHGKCVNGESVNEESMHEESMHVENVDDRGRGRDGKIGGASNTQGGQGPVSLLSSSHRAASIISSPLERAVQGFVRLLMVEEQGPGPGSGPGIKQVPGLGAVLAQLFFNDDGDRNNDHDHAPITTNAPTSSSAQSNGTHTNGTQANTHTNTLTNYVHTSVSDGSHLLPALLVVPHPMGRAEGQGLGAGLGLGLGSGFGTDALTLAMRLLSREVCCTPFLILILLSLLFRTLSPVNNTPFFNNDPLF